MGDYETWTSRDEAGWYAGVCDLANPDVDLHTTGWFGTEDEAKVAALKWAKENGGVV